MAGDLDLILWLSGGVLGLLGAALLYWSMLRDRARGRRRCPKCWYDMSGTPGLVCSECGKQVKSPRQLLRTRRRWFSASMSFLILAAAVALVLTPRVRDYGVASILPTTILIVLVSEPQMPAPATARPPTILVTFPFGSTVRQIPAPPPPARALTTAQRLSVELDRRIRAGKLADWQFRWLFRRAIGKGLPIEPVILSRKAWPSGVEIWASTHQARVGSLSPWLDRGRFRLLIERDGAQQEWPILLTRTLHDWRSRTAALGRLPDGASQLPCRVHLDYDCSSPTQTRIVRLWSGDHSLQLVVGGHLEEHIRPVESEAVAEVLRRGLWVAVYSSSMRVVRVFPKLSDLPEGIAFGLEFELLRDGQPVAAAEGWWGNNSAQRTSEHLPMSWGSVDLKSSGTWTLRVRGKPELALRAFDDKPGDAADHSHYWSGEVIIPLQRGERGEYLVPAYPLPKASQWTWSRSTGETRR